MEWKQLFIEGEESSTIRIAWKLFISSRRTSSSPSKIVTDKFARFKIRMAYVWYVQFNKQCCQDLILKKVKVETESPLRKMTSWIGRKTYSIFGYGEEEKSTRNLVSGAVQRFSSVLKMLTFQPQRRQSRHLLQRASPPQGRKKMRWNWSRWVSPSIYNKILVN